jgi:hypothetical protein
MKKMVNNISAYKLHLLLKYGENTIRHQIKTCHKEQCPFRSDESVSEILFSEEISNGYC